MVDIGGGIARGLSAGGYAAADILSKQALEQERSRLEEERSMRVAENMVRLKEESEARGRIKVGGIVSAIPKTRDIATPEGPVVAEPIPRKEYSRNVGIALAQGGYGSEADRFIKDADRVEDNERLDRKETREESRQKSEDEKWRTQFNELTRHHKAVEDKAAAELGLKKEERKQLSSAIKAYTTALTRYTMLAPNADEQMKNELAANVQGAAASLLPFNIKASGVESGKRGTLKVMKGEVGEADTLIHEDSKGGVTRVDPRSLPAYDSGAGPSPQETTAQSDARRAVATGKISQSDANKRLQAAGFKPI